MDWIDLNGVPVTDIHKKSRSVEMIGYGRRVRRVREILGDFQVEHTDSLWLVLRNSS